MNIIKRHILYIKKVRLRHDSPISVNARVIQTVDSSKRVFSQAISLWGSKSLSYSTENGFAVDTFLVTFNSKKKIGSLRFVMMI